MNILPRLRCTYFGSGPILVAVLITAAIISAVGGSIHGVEVFRDPVASLVAFDDAYKAKDLKVVELSVLLIAGFSISITMVCHWIAASRAEFLTAFNELLLVSLLPAAWRLALACSIPSEHFPPLRFVAGFPLAALLSIWGMARYRSTLQAKQVLVIGGGILISTLFSIYAGLCFPVAISRVIPKTATHFLGTAPAFAGAGLILVIAMLMAFWIASRTAEQFEQRVLATLKWIQYALPLLFFYMVPPVLIDPLHRFADPYPHALVATLFVCCIVSWLLMWRRFSRPVGTHALANVIAPVAVAALLLFINCGSSDLPRAYRDYFHWGEQSLPWQQWWDFGRRPYADYVPVHGLMPFLRGFFSEAFFDGSAASYTSSDVLLTGLASVALGLCASMLITPLGALFMLMGQLPYLDRMYFLAPALFLIAAPAVSKKPAKHLCIWMTACILMVLYNPTIGPAFFLGTTPLGFWLLYRVSREKPLVFTVFLLLVLTLVVACWEIKPARIIEIEFAHFLLDNAWTNEVAHGITWDRGFNQRSGVSGVSSTQFLWELSRIGWAVVALLAAGIFWKESQRESNQRRAPLMILAGCTPLVFLITAPWVLGRLDPGAFGRSGSLARLAIYSVLPAMVMLYASREKLIGALLLTAIIVGYNYSSNPASFDLDTSVAQAVQTRQIPADSQMVDGKTIGLPRLGQVIRPVPDFVSEIVGLKKTLSEFLKPGETFLDTTNESALYYYLDLPSPVRYPAWVAANGGLQAGEMQQLKNDPVHAVLIGPASWLDEVPSSLRNYQIYRQYTLKFCALQRGQWKFLVDPARLPSVTPIGSQDQLQLLDSVFRRQNLLRLPVSWGQSWKYMQDRFDQIAVLNPDQINNPRDVKLQQDGRLAPVGPSPTWDYAIPPAVQDGATADFVRLKFEDSPTDPASTSFCLKNLPWPEPVSVEAAMACRWAFGDGHFSEPIQFKAQPGNMILPLGAYPRWLLGKAPLTFRLELKNPRSEKWWKISEIEFLHLRPL